ncbi:hypothetical protein TWF192_004258 [Orbilia oligospora]|uniref:BTB domain-containing protein n=1 Tax=Orbilia oligospora TaxID=2813651 RepID=A0A6G1MBL6_ORBOL|nr:hypothetical protein TWF191_002377 [Orbilia oligospora]KAF3252973.1 hypothetical protein TWF192_004258 [Orbilia oligospora]
MVSGVGSGKQPDRRTSDGPPKEQTRYKDLPSSPAQKLAIGKSIGPPKAPAGSPKVSGELPKPSPGGKLSSFMQPTAASASKARANTDSYLTTLAAGITRSPIARRNKHPTIPAQEDKGLLEPENSALAVIRKPRKESGSSITGGEGLQTIKEEHLETTAEETPASERQLRPPSTDSLSGLVPGRGLNIGYLVTPTEFYNRPASSIAIHLRDTPDDNLDPELLEDLKRKVLELHMQVRRAYSDNESVHSWENPTNYDTMTTDSHIEQGGPEEHSSEQSMHAEFEKYRSEPDPEHDIVVIVGPENIGFSLNSDAISGHSYTIKDVIERMDIPGKSEVREIVFPEMDPYGFLYVLEALFTGNFPTPETDGRKAEALMLDAALHLQIPRVVSVLRANVSEKLKNETLDIEVALRFANALYKHGNANDIRDFWHEDAFVRRALRQTNVANLIERSPDLLDDRTWMVPGFKHELGNLFERTHLRI